MRYRHPRETYSTDRARSLRAEATEAERKLWWVLRQHPLRWRRQHPIGRYIVDFCALRERVIVELDGSQHDGSAYDRRRDHWLAARGFTVLRLWNDLALREPETVIGRIEAEMAMRDQGK